MGASLEGARREIARLLGDPPAGALLADSAVRALGRVVGHDGYCLFGVDPTTGLRSVMFSRRGLTVPTEVLMHNETVDRDANRYVDLARAPVPAAALTPHDNPRSRRLHEILPTDGYRGELRLALVTPGHYWGALSLFRDDPRRPFTETDVDTAHALAPQLADVLRRYQVGRPHDRPPTSMTGGSVCLDARDAVVGMDADARRYLAGFSHQWHDGVVPEDMMRCVHEVAAAARGGARPSPGRASPTGSGWSPAAPTSAAPTSTSSCSCGPETSAPCCPPSRRGAGSPTARPTSCDCSSRASPPSRSPVGSASRYSPSATTSVRSTARPASMAATSSSRLLV